MPEAQATRVLERANAAVGRWTEDPEACAPWAVQWITDELAEISDLPGLEWVRDVVQDLYATAARTPGDPDSQQPDDLWAVFTAEVGRDA